MIKTTILVIFTFSSFIAFLLVLPISALASEIAPKNAAISLLHIKIKPSAGVLFPRGANLKVSYIAGLNFEWDVNGIADLRFGYECSNPNIDGGNDLKISRVPFVVISKLKKDRLLGKIYLGLGGTYTAATYDDQSHDNVHSLGLLILAGAELSKNFTIELKYDSLKKNTREYGGVSLYLLYDGF